MLPWKRKYSRNIHFFRYQHLLATHSEYEGLLAWNGDGGGVLLLSAPF